MTVSDDKHDVYPDYVDATVLVGDGPFQFSQKNGNDIVKNRVGEPIPPEQRYKTTDTTASLSNTAEADLMETDIVVQQDRGDVKPSKQQEISLKINGRVVYTGIIKQVKENDSDILFSVQAENLKAELRRGSTHWKPAVEGNVVATREAKEFVKGLLDDFFDEPERRAYDYPEFSFEGEETDTLVSRVGIGQESTNYEVALRSFDGTPAEFLDHIAGLTASAWYVDRFNQLVFGSIKKRDQFPNTDDSDQDSPINLTYIKELNSGDSFVPYNGVIINAPERKGDNERVGSQTFPDYKREAPNKHAQINYHGLERKFGERPFFRYEADEGMTLEQIDKRGKNMVAYLNSKSVQGGFTVVGGEELTLNTIASLPSQVLTENIFVNKVTYTLNNDDGFVSDVDAGGTMPGAEFRANASISINQDVEAPAADGATLTVSGIQIQQIHVENKEDVSEGQLLFTYRDYQFGGPSGNKSITEAQTFGPEKTIAATTSGTITLQVSEGQAVKSGVNIASIQYEEKKGGDVKVPQIPSTGTIDSVDAVDDEVVAADTVIATVEYTPTRSESLIDESIERAKTAATGPLGAASLLKESRIYPGSDGGEEKKKKEIKALSAGKVNIKVSDDDEVSSGDIIAELEPLSEEEVLKQPQRKVT